MYLFQKRLNSMKIKAIIFDLDDTLYPEERFVESGFESVSEYMEKEFRIDKKDFFKVLMGILKKEGRGRVFDFSLKKYNLLDKKLVHKLVKVYRFHQPSIKLYPGVINLLNFLRKRYKLALITDGIRYVQRNKVKALGIEKFFDLVIYTADYGEQKSKPNSLSFKEVFKYFNLTPKEIIAVGDNPQKDFSGVKTLGISTIRVLQGPYRNLKVLRKLDAHHCIKRLTTIPRIIRIIETNQNQFYKITNAKTSR